jgi:putative FmdB family regulatory protein
MPIYDYACSKCAEQFEVLVRNGEPVACPECGSTKLEKLLSAPVAHVAGGSNSLPIAQANCGKPQCQSGCQFS